MKSSLVLIRGLARGRDHWADFKSSLLTNDPDLKLHFLEIPGNGTRFSEDTPLSPEEIIQDFRAQLVREEAQLPVRLVGISLGGMLALKWAELYPEEIESAFIINSSLKNRSPFYLRLLPSNLSLIIKALGTREPRERERIILQMTVNKKEVIDTYLDQFTKLSICYPLRISNFIRQLLLANLIKIQKPPKTRIVFVCSKVDKMVHFSCSQHIREIFGGDLWMHPSAGHDLPLEEPNWLAKIILSLNSSSTDGEALS